MTLSTSTLRPGYLVSLKTSVKGNVSYTKEVIKSETTEADGSTEEAWETTKHVSIPDEHKAACKTRSKARALISSVCSWTSFGLLCPDDKKEELEAAVIAAQEMAVQFNVGSQQSKIEIYAILGRVVQDDVQAVEAINSEVRDLMTRMQDGIKTLDAQAVRQAAAQARNLGQMLSEDAQKRVAEAVKVARAAAKEIVKAGETAAGVVDQEAIAAIARQRHAFLDLDGGETEIAVPVSSGRAIDMEMEQMGVTAWVEQQRAQGRQVDLSE
jgi:hypothetical protein